jgi:hypothetical protein
MTGDPADVAILVRDLLALAQRADRDGMCALCEPYTGRPEVLAAACVMLGGYLALVRLDAALATAERAAALLTAAGR